MLLRLAHDACELDIAPAIGGGIAALRFKGRDMLRPASESALAQGDPLGLAEFPMAPYVNRVRDARFSWRGETISLAAEAPHALHGTAWRRPWRIAAQGAAHAILRLDAAASPAWPFPFELTRAFTLTADSLTIDMELRATGDAPMPAAIGMHPFFPAAGARLSANVGDAWETRGDIPIARGLVTEAQRITAGSAIADLALDNCFTDWDGRAALAWPTHQIGIETEPRVRFLQIYTPRGAAHFCVEPQTAMPDALNHQPDAGGLRILGPGETLALRAALRFSNVS